MRVLAPICVFLLSWPALAGTVRTEQGKSLDAVVTPTGPRDFSAHRVDAEVFGWNKDFSELGCLGMELVRDRTSQIVGESFLLVFPTDSVKPRHNVQTLFNSDAPNPNDPPPLMDVRDRMWGIDEAFQRLWPKRPKRKRPRKAMKVEVLWEKIEVEEGLCQPAVGFVLRWKGETRVLPHQRLKDIQTGCALLEMTDNRTYWGRKDIAAAMPRFDFSTNPDKER
ncbi:MAG: hypothetical protein AAF658_12045, partial [Myxococcota bacterium]